MGWVLFLFAVFSGNSTIFALWLIYVFFFTNNRRD